MLMRNTLGRRHGSVLPLLVVGMVALVSFIGLAVDVGMIMVAKNQAQNAADAAAMAGARTLDGSATGNTANATTQAKTAAKANFILNQAIVDDNVNDTVTVQHGYYYYDTSTQTFSPVFPPAGEAPPPPDNWNLTKVSVARTNKTSFAGVFGQGTFGITGTAIAAHRPRDVAIVLDYSGSMNNESDIWNNEGYLGAVNNSPNNNDTVNPAWGHYSSTSVNLVNTNGDTRVGRCNVTQAALGVSKMVDDYFQNNVGAGATQAFSSAGNTTSTPVSGDDYLKITQNTGATYAQTVTDIVSNTTFDQDFEINGYSTYLGNLNSNSGRWWDTTATPTSVRGFKGFSQGPKYWGKTFFMWPPDPRRKGAISQAQVKTWLRELGYTNNDLTLTDASTPARNANQKKVQGIFQTVTGVQATYSWNTGTSWPADGTALATYLQTVPRPVNPGNPSSTSDLPTTGVTLMTTSDATFQKIMGLHDRVNLTVELDWRARFFFEGDGVTPMDDNNLLWDAAGNWLDPVVGGTTNYVINYAAILDWIKNSGPNPFPTQLRAGRILYYDSIPSDVPSGAYTWTANNNTISDANQRFWKEYIDWVLGVWRDPYGVATPPQRPSCSIGPDFTWGTINVHAKPGTNAAGHQFPQYMDYSDNPERPRHRTWFGPMTMVQFISDTGKNPGTINDISMMAAKLGIHGAIQDTKANHPNDLITLCMFNRPPANGDPVDVGQFANSYFNLSRNYTAMIDSLYYPPTSSASSDVRLWDNTGAAVPVPRAFGDFTANTCTNYGFILAYNQFSSSSTLRSTSVGGGGRKGAARLVVLETDGMANVQASAPFTTSVDTVKQVNNSYFDLSNKNNITLSGSNVSGTVLDQARKLCAPIVDTPSHPLNSYRPGFAQPNKPVKLHCVAFGAVFETTASGTEPDNAISLLQSLSTIGGTGFPSSRTDSGSPDFYKLITGDQTQRQTNLRAAFSKIMADGIAVTLVK